MKKALIISAVAVACFGVVALWGLSGPRTRQLDLLANNDSKLVLPPDLRACDPDPASADYISKDQHRGLVRIFDEHPNASPFDALSNSQQSIVAASLQMGISRSFYSARILRTAEIILQIDFQQSCMLDSACKVNDISLVDHLKTGAFDDPNREVSWAKLRQDWHGYLIQDIDLARRCFQF